MAFPVVATSATTAVQNTAPGKPTGLAVGDLIVLTLASVAYTNSNAVLSAPDGTWTTVNYSHTSTNANGVWYKVATSTEVSASSFGSLTGDRTCGSVLRITGVNTTTPIGASNSSAGTTCSSITPVVQSLLLNIIASGNNVSTQPSVSSYAIANSNPSWTQAGSISSSIASNQSCACLPAWANQTGAYGTSTGTVTDTVVGGGVSIVAILAIQPIVATPTLVTATFTIFAPIISIVIHTLLSAVFNIFAPSETTSTKWTRQQKSTGETWTTQNKEIT